MKLILVDSSQDFLLASGARVCKSCNWKKKILFGRQRKKKKREKTKPHYSTPSLPHFPISPFSSLYDHIHAAAPDLAPAADSKSSLTPCFSSFFIQFHSIFKMEWHKETPVVDSHDISDDLALMIPSPSGTGAGAGEGGLVRRVAADPNQLRTRYASLMPLTFGKHLQVVVIGNELSLVLRSIRRGMPLSFSLSFSLSPKVFSLILLFLFRS